ncbi:MAG: HAMP domain-containing histidine kinase [Dechloromonas sp.]|nr:HAMP domain-containing histidine kinase [Dechloromonas sp.]
MGNSNISKPFNLLRWFSIASLLALLPVAAATGYVLSYFITEATLQRDAALTAQFIQNCVAVEGMHASLGDRITFSELLDERVNPEQFGISQAVAEAGRKEITDHLQGLPDTLLANLFAPDGRIIWSTNKELIGQVSSDNHELAEAFESEVQVARHHASNQAERGEQRFIVEPKEFFIENYIPLHDAKGKVVVVAEIYKEPRNLVAVIKRGQYLVWGATLVAGALVYLALFSIIRRGSSMLDAQRNQLVEMDAMAFMGEMSTAVAHSLRNPLANIRSSAELAMGSDDSLVQKNAQDIITQVDFLSRWVRQMQHYARPVTGETEAVNLMVIVDDVLKSFEPTLHKAGITVDRLGKEDTQWPRIEGNVPLVTQALHSVLTNAIEAMPKGGVLSVDMALQMERGRCELAITDTGVGMSERQLASAFKPFQTTKRNGLGVGLPMVKRVMDRFGGEISLASQENQGTEVRLQFKLAGE